MTSSSRGSRSSCEYFVQKYLFRNEISIAIAISLSGMGNSVYILSHIIAIDIH